MTKALQLVAIGLAAIAPACAGIADTPTGPSTVTLTSEYFSGSLGVGGSKFYSFSVSDPGGSITAMLASVTAPASGVALPAVVGLGVGIPSGTGCALTKSVETAASLTAQLYDSARKGVYCINVYDIGNLSADVNFAIRFSHP